MWATCSCDSAYCLAVSYYMYNRYIKCSCSPVQLTWILLLLTPIIIWSPQNCKPSSVYLHDSTDLFLWLIPLIKPHASQWPQAIKWASGTVSTSTQFADMTRDFVQAHYGSVSGLNVTTTLSYYVHHICIYILHCTLVHTWKKSIICVSLLCFISRS